MNLKSCKGQMEIIGLVIIVILITLGMLFLATFALKQDQTKKVFTREGLAYSTLSALVKTTTGECVGQSSLALGDRILEDCARNKQLSSSLYHCGNPPVHSCEFFEEKVRYLLRQSLGKWNKHYEFRSSIAAASGSEPKELLRIVSDDNAGCPISKDRDSANQPFQSNDVGLIETVLYICE